MLLKKMTFLFSLSLYLFLCSYKQRESHLSLIVTNIQNIDTNLSIFPHNNTLNIFSLYFTGAEDIFQVTKPAKYSPKSPYFDY